MNKVETHGTVADLQARLDIAQSRIGSLETAAALHADEIAKEKAEAKLWRGESQVLSETIDRYGYWVRKALDMTDDEYMVIALNHALNPDYKPEPTDESS